MYYCPVRERVVSYIRRHKLMRAGDRVGVAVSGGADSVALLRMLLEVRDQLGVVLAVVHFNHQIRGADADADEQFVADLAAAHGLEFYRDSFDTSLFARQHHLSLEAGGRDLRYMFFMNLLAGKLNTIATAHTMDDQAETVLLRIMRGAGTRGLAGIFPKLVFACASSELKDTVVRPLLGVRRAELREYLQSVGQSWREDASNLDLKHTRNRLRHQLLPIIECEFNSSIVPVLADMAEVARAEEEYWDALIEEQTNTAVWDAVAAGARSPEPGTCLAQSPDLRACLDRRHLLAQPLAVQRRLLRGVAGELGMELEFRHVEKILEAASGIQPLEAKELKLPEGWVLTISSRELKWTRGSLLEQQQGREYKYLLPVPGEVHIPELGAALRALVLPAEQASAGYNPSYLLDSQRLEPELLVRNWRPGDRFRPAHSKAARKLKELLLRHRIPQSRRTFWPVVLSGDAIVWVPGIGASAELVAGEGSRTVVVIEEATAGSRPNDA